MAWMGRLDLESRDLGLLELGVLELGLLELESLDLESPDLESLDLESPELLPRELALPDLAHADAQLGRMLFQRQAAWRGARRESESRAALPGETMVTATPAPAWVVAVR